MASTRKMSLIPGSERQPIHEGSRDEPPKCQETDLWHKKTLPFKEEWLKSD